MDQKKVFVDKGHVPPELLAKVEKSKLKVELCEDCSCLNEKFSEGYRQLEKLEMELGSTLRLIHEKLKNADATDKLSHGLSLGSNLNWSGLLEVLDVLRGEAVQKSYRKLSGSPRVKIQNISKKKIRGKQFKLKNSLGSIQKNLQLDRRSTDLVSDSGLETSDVKTEYLLSDDCLSDNNDFSHDVNFNMDDKDVDAETANEMIIKYEMDAMDTIGTGDTIVSINPISQKAINRVGTGKWSINPETGKRKCNACYKEFNKASTFTRHYQTVHLKLRYKCISCDKLFTRKTSLELHQRTSQSCSATESAPKYNCHLCEKSFALKHHLRYHLEGVHYKLQKYECDLCKKKFNTDGILRNHRKRVHRLLK